MCPIVNVYYQLIIAGSMSPVPLPYLFILICFLTLFPLLLLCVALLHGVLGDYFLQAG